MPRNGVELDLVQVTTREGKKIMIQRHAAEAIEESWTAINDLTQKVLLQQEAFQKQNQEVEELNESLKRNFTANTSGVTVTLSRNIDQIITGMVVVFFFFKTHLVAAAVLFRTLPNLCACKWDESSLKVRNTIKTIALCGAVITLATITYVITCI